MSPAAPPFLPMPEYQDPNSHPHCVPAVGSSYPRGLYVETPEPSLLSDLFLRIFLEIKKARLVE
jgi:hypothetical protein